MVFISRPVIESCFCLGPPCDRILPLRPKTERLCSILVTIPRCVDVGTIRKDDRETLDQNNNYPVYYILDKLLQMLNNTGPFGLIIHSYI